jgi:hypothetical protein
VSSWFKTSTNFGTEGFIVNKGGLGTDTAGLNMNYAIWMTSGEKLIGGFETGSGTDNFVTSPGTYNDGLWHYVSLTCLRVFPIEFNKVHDLVEDRQGLLPRMSTRQI